MPLDSWSIFRDSTITLASLCVQRDAPAIPLGSMCICRDAPPHKPPIKMPPSTFLSHPRFVVRAGDAPIRLYQSKGRFITILFEFSAIFYFENLVVILQFSCIEKFNCVMEYFYTIYLSKDSTAQRVCSQGVGSNPPEFLKPCGLPVSCYLATSVVPPLRQGLRGLPSSRIFMFLGGMKAEFVLFTPQDLGVRVTSIVRMWTFVFGRPQLGLISPLQFPSGSGYILGSEAELN